MLPSLRRRVVAVGLFSGPLIAIVAGTLPADAKRRACTNAELGRVSESFIIDCFKKPGARVSCQSNGDPVCCYNTPWGAKCTTNPGASSFDPGSGPTRPPRAGMPNPPPDRVGPYTPLPPRMGGNPDRVGDPGGPARPPRSDPGPSRVGPSTGPTGGASIPRSSGGKR